MIAIDELFTAPKKYEHSKLRAWLAYKDDPDIVDCWLRFQRARLLISFEPPYLYLEATRRNGTSIREEMPWRDDLDAALLEHGFRAQNEENEGKRFGFTLLNRLHSISGRWNVFNSSLMSYLEETGFAHHPLIADLISKAGDYPPRQSKAARECREDIHAVFGNCARELKGLGYDLETGKRILNAALAYYLDCRYCITSRSILGAK